MLNGLLIESKVERFVKRTGYAFGSVLSGSSSGINKLPDKNFAGKFCQFACKTFGDLLK